MSELVGMVCGFLIANAFLNRRDSEAEMLGWAGAFVLVTYLLLLYGSSKHG